MSTRCTVADAVAVPSPRFPESTGPPGAFASAVGDCARAAWGDSLHAASPAARKTAIPIVPCLIVSLLGRAARPCRRAWHPPAQAACHFAPPADAVSVADG